MMFIAGNEVIEQQKKHLEQLRTKAAVDAHLSWLNKRQTQLTDSVNGDHLSQQVNDLILSPPLHPTAGTNSAQGIDLQKELRVAVSPSDVPHTMKLNPSSPVSPQKSYMNETTSPTAAVFSSDDSSLSSPQQPTDSNIKSVCARQTCCLP